MRHLALLVLTLFTACPRQAGPPQFDSLIGLEAPLLPGPGLRVALPGQLFETPTEVVIDVGASMTLVTSGCFDPPMVAGTRVEVQGPLGDDEVYPVTRLAGLTVSGRRLVAGEAGLAQSSTCAVVLGTDRLVGTALQLDPARRLVRFVPSRARADWQREAEALGGEAQVLELTKDPRHDWPLLAVRLKQGASVHTGAFVLSTRERVSRTFETPLVAAGFVTTAALLSALELPPGVKLPMDVTALQTVTADDVEVAPGLGAKSVSVALVKGAPPRGVLGALAADVWGRFETTIDVGSGTLVLHRPRVLGAGARFACARGAAQPTDEACFQLESFGAGRGLAVTATVWRPLAEGGRFYFDLPGVGSACRVGVTFDPGDRGRSAQHVLPWPRLFETMKGCAAALASATSVSPGLFEEGPLRECPGVCAFAQDLRSGRVSCECQSGPMGLPSGLERNALDRIREQLKRQAEPSDPEP